MFSHGIHNEESLSCDTVSDSQQTTPSDVDLSQVYLRVNERVRILDNQLKNFKGTYFQGEWTDVEKEQFMDCK